MPNELRASTLLQLPQCPPMFALLRTIFLCQNPGVRKSDTTQSSFPAGHAQIDDTHVPSHAKVTELIASSRIALLPPEILCQIFLTALPDPPKIPIHSSIGPLSSSERITGDPWVFARVCQRWRALALASPNLWASIAVTTVLSERDLPALYAQLQRSKSAGLDILLKFQQGQRRSFEPFLSTLAGQCHRWRSIHLEFDGACPAPLAFYALGPMPRLKRVCFSGRGISNLVSYDFFKDAPNLSEVVLSSPGDFSIRNIPLPWAQLTRYTATYSDEATHFGNLSAASNSLVECDISFGSHGPDPPPELVRHGGSLTLLRLRRLVITHSVLLDSLVTPALQDLHVWGGIDRVLPFLHNSACALTRLALSMCDTAAYNIILLLRHTPSLKTLCIDFLGPTTESTALVSALVIRPLAEPLCSHLASISWGDRNDAMDRAGFVDMVVSRWRVSAPLRRLRFVGLYLGHPRMKGHGRRLRGLADEGMDVVILNGRKGTQAMDNWREC
ncbi:hypothetical protein B0H17DRAFT_1261053 [Mycena rosella]|uniref:F-box domain-containing protein n=1 Tax=Mycena rosella TaxID=1033263 RepID=A0AAD7DSG4_MYCRO|nr:hypothetical protein B0H17DRAFT_1261053 [Mycena rosella]